LIQVKDSIGRFCQFLKMDKLKALAGFPIFAGLSRPVLARLAAVSGMQRVDKGATLFREGERPHFLYGLVEGTVSLQGGPKGGEIISNFVSAGDVVLVPPTLLRLPYMVNAYAVSELLVVMIPAEEFRKLAESELSLAVAINRMLSAHWRLLLRHLTQTRVLDARTRLRDYLADNAGKDQGPARITLPGTKRELAAHLGMTPETLSRSLKRLGRLGVRTDGIEIEIDDISRLKTKLYKERRASRARQADA
jgi:CRP/FNR family transcriptional activator FtrB